MANRLLKILISLAAAGLFLWLALRSVDLPELWGQIRQVKLGWIFPFTLVVGISHYLRAERWRMLITDKNQMPLRSTLFAGVMTGYLLNYIFPRLGEVTRPVYVARQSGVSTGNLFGTIVLERAIDLLCMAGFLLYITVYMISDRSVLGRMFGTDAWLSGPWLLLPAVLVLLAAALWFIYRRMLGMEKEGRLSHPLLLRILHSTGRFIEGLKSIRQVSNWPLFFLLTVGIWGGYVLMTYLPFRMLDLHTIYDLGFTEAVIITVISATGMSMPTPGGLGSYHLFVQQALWLLYDVPLVTALTYATVTHAVNLLVVIAMGLGTLWWDKYYTLTSSQ